MERIRSPIEAVPNVVEERYVHELRTVRCKPVDGEILDVNSDWRERVTGMEPT
jgi:hypothetical protein